MRSVSQPMERLVEDGAWFARAHEVRLLALQVSADLRNTALRLLPMLEFHADNFSPWVVLQQPRTAEDDGWQVRADLLVEQWEQRREAFAEDGQDVAGLPDIPDSAEAPFADLPPGMKRFCRVAVEVLRVLPRPMHGLVLLLAPTVVDDVGALGRDIATLLAAPELSACRVVLVTPSEQPSAQGLTDRLGNQALSAVYGVDQDRQGQDIAAMLAEDNTGGAGVTGAGPAGVTPPRRVDAPPKLSRDDRDAALREAGVDPAVLSQSPRLSRLVLGAALAMKRGQSEEALAMQTEACRLARRVGLHEVAVTGRVTLASYLSGLDRRDEALAQLDRAVVIARTEQIPQSASQAHLARGLIHALEQRFSEAEAAYVDAARAAEEAGVELLAIEGWRLAGQIAAQAGREAAAAGYFHEAIRVAEGGRPQLVQRSGAPEVARQLAALYAARGQTLQAESLLGQADAMERGEVGTEEGPADDTGDKHEPPPSDWEA